MRPSRFLRALACASLVALVGCGESNESPEDCLGFEYFDEGQQACVVCVAPPVPQCAAGCGIVIERDSRGCPRPVCACDLCEDGAYFDRERLTCERCAEGQEYDRELSRCVVAQ